MTGAAFFDLDKTVIAKSSTLAFGKPFYQGGLVNRRAVLKSTYAQFVYLVAGADADQMDRMRDYLKHLCTGWDVAQVKQIVDETLHDLIDPLVYDEAVDLIEEHKANGRRVVIVSSSGEEVVGPIGEMVGADEVVATRMVVEDGKYTGDIEFYAYGTGKADAIRELAERHGWDLADCWAYSDSFTDLPMLEVVGHPVAVNPDKALRRVSVERDWPIREFRRPVSLASRLASRAPKPSPNVLAGAAVGVAGAALAVRYYRRRTRESQD
ncbi:MAG TPA: HAD family hydrolase [Frankiaceae bacterium]|jgi:HAD superfamily hydrolase (TIGR01490 family)|nr:HAD family hydrolase [Frankiaceae bacterium]